MSKLIEQIARDAATVASWPKCERDRCRAELSAIFRNPGIQFRALGEKQ